MHLKTGNFTETLMAPILALILGQILDYLADHADEIVKIIKDAFLISETDPEVHAAIQELGYEPTEENLTKLHNILKAKGEDTDKLAQILVNNTVTV